MPHYGHFSLSALQLWCAELGSNSPSSKTPNTLKASYSRSEGPQAWLPIPVTHFPPILPYSRLSEDSHIPQIDESITN